MSVKAQRVVSRYDREDCEPFYLLVTPRRLGLQQAAIGLQFRM
jgi:hypothetical protein